MYLMEEWQAVSFLKIYFLSQMDKTKEKKNVLFSNLTININAMKLLQSI